MVEVALSALVLWFAGLLIYQALELKREKVRVMVLEVEKARLRLQVSELEMALDLARSKAMGKE